MSEETKLLIDQIERMNNFYMWSVGIFITIIIAFFGGVTWIQFRMSSKQEKKLIKKVSELVDSEISNVTLQIKKNTDFTTLSTNFNYLRGLFINVIDKENIPIDELKTKGVYRLPSIIIINRSIELLNQIEAIILKYNISEDEKASIIHKYDGTLLAINKIISREQDGQKKAEAIDFIKDNIRLINSLRYHVFFENEENIFKKNNILNDLLNENPQTPNQP